MVTRPDGGWFWFIPLDDTVTSVGAVVPQRCTTRTRNRRPDETLAHFLAETPAAARLVAAAKPIGVARFDADYSYLHSRHAGDRFVLTGDAERSSTPSFPLECCWRCNLAQRRQRL